MVQINFAQRQVNAKIVFYGPGMSGKTTNLEIVHQRAPSPNRGDLTSISTDGDRTLFFDFMPLDLGTVAGMRTCFQLYTVPGQVYYNSTRKLVLQGVDGIVFVADSSASMVEENLESLRNLEQNLAEYGKSLAQMPIILQYNKRDLPDALPVEELNRLLNPFNAPYFEAIANTGQGVFPTLKALAARVLESIHTGSKNNSGQGPQVTTGQTGFYAQPNVAAAPAPMPAARPQLAQTGYHTPAAAMRANPPAGVPQAPQQQPLASVTMGAGYADPLARTNVHPPPGPMMQPMQPMQSMQPPMQAPHGVPSGAPYPGHPSMAHGLPPQPPTPMAPVPFTLSGGQPGPQYAAPSPMAPHAGGALQSGMQQQMPPQPGYGYGQPMAPQQPMQPMQPMQPQMMNAQNGSMGQARDAGGNGVNLQMRGDRAQSAPSASPAAKSRAVAQPVTPAVQAPRIAPRQAALPTPGSGKRRLVYVGIFVGVALLIGTALARGILTIF